MTKKKSNRKGTCLYLRLGRKQRPKNEDGRRK